MITPTSKEQQLRAFIIGFLTDPAHDECSENSMTAQVFRIALAAMDADRKQCAHIEIDCDDGTARCLHCGKTWEV